MYYGKCRSQQVSSSYPKILEPWTGGLVQTKQTKEKAWKLAFCTCVGGVRGGLIFIIEKNLACQIKIEQHTKFQLCISNTSPAIPYADILLLTLNYTKFHPNRTKIAKVSNLGWFRGGQGGWLRWVKHGPDTLCVPFYLYPSKSVFCAKLYQHRTQNIEVSLSHLFREVVGGWGGPISILEENLACQIKIEQHTKFQHSS